MNVRNVSELRNEKTCKKGIKAKRFKAALQSDYAQKVLNGIFWALMRLPCRNMRDLCNFMMRSNVLF